ncbi:MAG: diphthamide biosynthesis enzyme Dph2 [Methanomicrobiales archaeon]|nr:diphthamide biosynthesis enzyme Dph2 [Methanomicrobiales archaeon]
MILSSDLIRTLRERNARRVALQFPAGLKREAFRIASQLKKEGFEPLISGDPCYGACDLADDLLAEADVLVHFGHAPLEPSSQVLYEIVSRDFDLEVLTIALPLISETRIGLVTTVQHVHLLDRAVQWLSERGIQAVVMEGSPRTPNPGQVLGCSFEAARRTGAKEILFVGTGLFHPIGIQLATGARVISLDPIAREVQVIDASRMLRKRFALIESARGAGSMGILVSLKRGQQRWDLARRLASLTDRAVLVAMHEVTPEELLDLGMECYVNTACPRLAYDDQPRFPVPVLTPSEFEILCGVRSWNEYQVDEIP